MRLLFYTLLLISGLPNYSYSDEWYQFETSAMDDINAVAAEGNIVWCATDHGVIRVDPESGTVRKFHEIHGLNDECVQKVVVGPSGIKWFEFSKPGPYHTEYHGIASYDGSVWKSYYSGYSVTYPGDKVSYMYVDSKDRLWITCGSHVELTCFDGETWTYYTPENSGVQEHGIASMAEESDGTLWLGGEFLTRYDGESWHTYTPDNSGLTHFAGKIAVDSSDKKWVAGYDVISSFDGETWTTYTSENSGLSGQGIAKVVAGAADDVWILYLSYKDVSHFNGEDWENFDREALGIGDGTIRDMALAGDGTLWLGCDNGLYRFDGERGEKWVGGTMPNIDRILDICVAANGDVWLSKGYYSVYHYDGRGWEYVYIPEKVGYAEGYKKSTYLTADSEGNVYFGSDKGIVSYDGAHWNLIVENEVDRSRSYVGKYGVGEIFEVDREGALWFLSHGEICVYQNGEFHWFQSYVKQYNPDEGRYNIKYPGAKDIFIDHENNKWFATAYHGIRKYDHSYGLDERYVFLDKEKYDPDPGKVMREVAVDFDDVIWYACDERFEDTGKLIQKGLRKIENGVVSDTIELPYVYVTDLEVDKNGVLWVGTKSDGVYKYEDGEFTRYTVKDGLLDNRVDRITIGPNNEKWFVSEEKGLTLYIDVPPVSVDEETAVIPETFGLSNHPNPFNPSTTIEFTLPAASDVKLTVHSVIGRKVMTLVEGRMAAGGHSVVFDGTGLASGLYFYRLEVGKTVKTGKMMLVR